MGSAACVQTAGIPGKPPLIRRRQTAHERQADLAAVGVSGQGEIDILRGVQGKFFRPVGKQNREHGFPGQRFERGAEISLFLLGSKKIGIIDTDQANVCVIPHDVCCGIVHNRNPAVDEPLFERGVVLKPGLMVAGDIIHRRNFGCGIHKGSGNIKIGAAGIHHVAGDRDTIRGGRTEQLEQFFVILAELRVVQVGDVGDPEA